MLPATAFATKAESLSIHEESAAQAEIDEIFTELNEMAAEEKLAEILAEENEKSTTATSEQDNARKQHLEKRLEILGVNTIDPNNPDDMAALGEVMLSNNNVSAQAIPDPPSLETFADLYTLRQYTSSITVDGTSYKYSYIYVTDDKGYRDSPLTHSQTTNILIGKESAVLSSILSYQFSFAFSAYLGTIPNGWIANWAIGTVCAALEGFERNSIISYTENKNIYNMSMLSVTQMMYVYVYLPGSGWCLCGSKAPNISYARVEYVIANVAGSAVSDSKKYPTVSSSTGSSAYTYARAYINGGTHTIHNIGSFTVNVYGGSTVRFTPGFANYPNQLL